MRLLLLLLATGLLAVACGSSDDTLDAGGDDGAAASGSASAPADGDVALDPDGGAEEPPDEPLGAGPYPVGTLDIEITDAEGAVRTYGISCLGDTATVLGDAPGGLSGDSMCTRLAEAAVQERLVNGEPVGLACTEQYGSADVAVVTGTLDDQPVATEFHRTNGCGIGDWDALMSGVLPAVG
ncbi:MAG: hypothetical protein AAGD35_14225 [Actinomycetota bacterium]